MKNSNTDKKPRLKALAASDRSDQRIIAEARERMRLRQLERGALGAGQIAGTSRNLPDNMTRFESFIKDFSLLNAYPDAIEYALRCPKCHRDPEDPILTDCLHVYCMQCFTHMLYHHQAKSNIAFVQCMAFEDHHITDCIELDNHQWEAIKATLDGDENTQNTATVLGPKSMKERVEVSHHCFTGDVERLWDALDWGNGTDSGSESSVTKRMQQGKKTEMEGDDAAVDAMEEDVAVNDSDDGFDERDTRSIGYESDATEISSVNDWGWDCYTMKRTKAI